MKKTMWMSLVSVVLFCLSQAGAAVTYYSISRLGITDPNTGDAYFKGAYEVNAVTNNNPCVDTISATQSESEGGAAYLIWQVQAAEGMTISSLSVGLDFQGDATNSGHIQVSYSTSPDGPWTEIVDAYVPGSYVWYNQTTTASINCEANICYVKCAVLPSWTDHAGQSTMWWRGFTLVGEETVMPTTKAPVFDPAGPEVRERTQVTISSETQGAVIYYTTDGQNPTTSGTPYPNPTTVTVNGGTTLKAIAVASDTSCISSQKYTTPEEICYYNILRLGITDSNTGDAYFKGAYEVNAVTNNDPCIDCISATQSEGEGGTASLIWRVQAGDGMMINALSVWLYFCGDATNSGHIQVSYSTTPEGPWTEIVDAYVPGSYAWYNQTTTASVSGEADIYYVKCAILPSWTNHAGQSNMWWRGFSLVGKETVVPTTKAPVFDPSGPEIPGDTVVTIRSETKDAVIYYTVNGDTPTTSGTQYPNPTTVTVTNGMTLKAIAVGTDTSIVKTQTYTYAKAPAPTFSPEGPMVSGATEVTIRCTSEGATIRYTTDGTDPSETNGTIIASGAKVLVTPPMTLKARAWLDGSMPSSIISATYTIPEYNRPEVISAGTATVDGNLSDWSGATWAPLDKTYDVSGSDESTLSADIAEAYYSAKWQANKLYVAVKVKDMAHFFEDTNKAWNGQDAVEIYLHTNGDSPIDYANCTSAQQYVIGIKKSDHTKAWANIGGAGTTYAIPEDGSFDAVGKAAVRVDGDWLYYEVEITPFTYFSYIVDGSMTNSVVTNLSAGDIIGLDVCVDGHNATAYSGMKSENTMMGKWGNWNLFGLHKLVSQTGSTAIIDRVADGTYSATGSSSPALTYGHLISTVNWISAGVGGKTFDLTNPKYNVVVTGTVTALTGESVGGSGGWMSLGLVNKHYLDGLAIGQDPGVTYASGQYGFGVNGGLSIVGGDVNHSANDAVVNIHDGWPNQTSDTHLGTNAFDFKVVYNFLDGDTRDERSIRAYWKPAGSDGWICLGTQYTMGYPLNATFTSGRSDYYLADQWDESQVGVMVTHDAAGQTASISIANMKLAYENVLSGDANFDNSVDVGDLGILAANYGKTSGATWDQGDFNGDGAVDVGDLGILAANYGKNASSANFEADYAKVFGTDSTSTETTDDSSTLCSSLGLSLITGLALMGLLIVKLEE